MRKVLVEFCDNFGGKQLRRENGDVEESLVNYEGVGLIGSSTLCGHTDWVGADFVEVKRRVNCQGCIAVRDHVLGR